MSRDPTPLVLSAWIAGLVLGGAVDLWLALSGRQTISDRVWACPWLGVPVLLWALIGPAYLAGHFYLGWGRP